MTYYSIRLLGSTILVTFLLICDGCTSHNEPSDPIADEPSIDEKIEPIDSMKQYYSWSVFENELRVNSEPVDSVVDNTMLKVSDGTTMILESGVWKKMEQVRFVRDRGGMLYRLKDNRKYQIQEGMLGILFLDQYLFYDYKVLMSKDEQFEATYDSVRIWLAPGPYYKRDDLVQFVTVDSIASNAPELCVFTGTDIEIDFDYESGVSYFGQLEYVHEERSRSEQGWTRNNFLFKQY